MIKIGDRVRFLNAVGGGVVTRFIKKDLVGVLDDDGFEIPVLAKECVVIEQVNKLNFPIQNSIQEPTVVQRIEIPVEPVKNKNMEEVWENEEETDYGNRLSLYFGFVPTNIKSLFNSSFDLFLINDSNYTLAYSYAVENHKQECQCRENGTMHPNTKLFLETLGKEDLNKMQQIVFQSIVFKKGKAYQPKPTLDSTIKLTISDFNKLHSFGENDFFEESALIIPLIEKDIPAAFLKPDPLEIQQAILQKDVPKNTKFSVSQNKKEQTRAVMEIDLHIGKLLDTTAGMDNAAILDCQMDKFRSTLDQYKNKKGQKLVFIHGKGEGVLRKEIVKELKAKYPGYYFQDASFREYGFGATMVTIK